MLLGYHTNCMAHHELFDAIGLLAEIGYRSVAITIDHGALSPRNAGPQEVPRLRRVLDQCGLRSVIETGARFLLDPRAKHEPTLVSPDPADRARRIDFYKHAIRCAAELGSDCVSLWSGAVRDAATHSAALERLVDGLWQVLDYAAEQGVVVAFEPEPGMLIDDMQRFDELLGRINAPRLRLTLDVGHLHCQREWPLTDSIRRWGQWLANVHLEDMRAGVHEHLMFGEGEIDFPPVLETLAAVGYQGGVHVELSRHSHEAPAAARRASRSCTPLSRGFRPIMPDPLVLLSVAGLREKDVAAMPHLRELTAGGKIAELTPSFPCVTCPVQANMTTGKPPVVHGVVANGFYWRESRRVEMWTSDNDCIARPQIWDLLSQHDENLKSAVWFPLHSQGCDADYICTPAPIHNPDGSESLWCYTRPRELYGTLRERFGHFPLQHFWGPMANVTAAAWIAASAAYAAQTWQPDFFYIYLPHLDYSAQRSGPDSPAADTAVVELDTLIGRMASAFQAAYGRNPVWLIAGEYAIAPVNHVVYPNRILREAGLLAVRTEDDGEQLDFAASRAWALVDHQVAHVFVADADRQTIGQVAELFRGQAGIAEVLTGTGRGIYQLDHPRSGEVILISTPNSWQAYYWWDSDDRAPAFARTVDIHRKPGYDPVELHFDWKTRSIPLDATLVKGSHGAPAVEPGQKTVLVASQPYLCPGPSLTDIEIFGLVLRHFGINLT